jgi:hypothetical protein
VGDAGTPPGVDGGTDAGMGTLTADGGASTRRNLRVSCGCGAVDGLWLGAALAWVMRRRRTERH